MNHRLSIRLLSNLRNCRWWPGWMCSGTKLSLSLCPSETDSQFMTTSANTSTQWICDSIVAIDQVGEDEAASAASGACGGTAIRTPVKRHRRLTRDLLHTWTHCTFWFMRPGTVNPARRAIPVVMVWATWMLRSTEGADTHGRPCTSCGSTSMGCMIPQLSKKKLKKLRSFCSEPGSAQNQHRPTPRFRLLLLNCYGKAILSLLFQHDCLQ